MTQVKRAIQAGFTLVEVLVAMVILAVSLAAASRAAALGISHSHEIKQRILADMVAQNRLAEHALTQDWLEDGIYTGVESQANITFTWKEQVSSTPNPAFKKITVKVMDPEHEAHHLRILTGFLVNPAFQGVR